MKTIGEALRRYLKSADFWSKAQSTQAEYRRVAEILIKQVGSVPLPSVDRSLIRDWRDSWREQHRAATIKLQVLKNALAPLMSDGRLPKDLFDGHQRVQTPHGLPEPNVAWTDQEVEAVIAHCLATGADGLAKAVALARYQGLRRGEICKLTSEARYVVVRRGGRRQRRLRCTVGKNGQIMDLPEDPRLTKLLDDTVEVEGLLAYNKRCLAWRPRQLNQALDRVIEKLSGLGLVRPNLTLHGMRHARGTEMAEAGLSDAHIMAQMGHADEQSARVYRRQAQRTALADDGQRLVNQSRARHARSISRRRPDDEETAAPDERALEAQVKAIDRKIQAVLASMRVKRTRPNEPRV